jgi:hypothetical protein
MCPPAFVVLPSPRQAPPGPAKPGLARPSPAGPGRAVPRGATRTQTEMCSLPPCCNALAPPSLGVSGSYSSVVVPSPRPASPHPATPRPASPHRAEPRPAQPGRAWASRTRTEKCATRPCCNALATPRPAMPRRASPRPTRPDRAAPRVGVSDSNREMFHSPFRTHLLWCPRLAAPCPAAPGLARPRLAMRGCLGLEPVVMPSPRRAVPRFPGHSDPEDCSSNHFNRARNSAISSSVRSACASVFRVTAASAASSLS